MHSEYMKKNQFLSTVITQGDRLTVEIPAKVRDNFWKYKGKDLKITLEEL